MTIKMPKVVLLGVPDSGIYILNELVSGMPPLRPGGWINQWEEDVYARLKTIRDGEVWAGYLDYSREMKQWLDDHRIRRIFIYRDPRDVLLDQLSFILNEDNKHLYYPYFTRHMKSLDERLMKMITGFYDTRANARRYGLQHIGYSNINHVFIPYLRWLQDPNLCTIPYENLVNAPSGYLAEMHRIADYLWKDTRLSERSKTEYLQRLQDAPVSQALQHATTGEWKRYFTDEIKRVFKQTAGELLIYLGYESDDHW
ncbi:MULTISPECIES: sulfotransferase domain-containing protein [unclassified Paenibacillus]|uniref:sulfotransferase domain-containing protein n=1 Tax=unclassified Paenibacillus TaxID=185978 RepID=UPI0006D14582|nr:MULTISPECIES: sulfotransferase domain-containing protein [unclassified Paenibacillus]